MAGPFDFLFGGGSDPDPQQTRAQQQATRPTGMDISQYLPPRAAAGEGTILGAIDHFMGVPTQQQINVGLDRQQNASSVAIMNRIQELKTENPKMPKAMLSQRLLADPVFLKNAVNMPSKDIWDMVSKVNENLFGEDKYITAPADSTILQANEAMGQPPRPVYQAPKSFKPGDIKIARSFKGGDPRLEKDGFPGLNPAKDYEVKYSLRPDGTEYATDIGLVEKSGVTIDMREKNDITDMNSRLKARNDLVNRQKSVLGAVRAADRIETLLDEGGAKGIGPLGFVNRFGEGLIDQAKAAAGQAGVIFDPAAYAQQFKGFKGLSGTAANSAAVQSNILALAYTIAQANNNGSGNLSKKDVDQALEIIGANFGSTTQLRSALREMVGNAVQSYDDAVDLETPLSRTPDGKYSLSMPPKMKDTLGELGLSHYLKKPRAGAAASPQGAGTTNAGPQKGQRFTGPDGVVYEFQGGANVKGNWRPVQ